VALKSAKQSAYLLVSAVAAITLEAPDTFVHLRDALEPLLICGIYSDATSMVPNIAFRLLTMLLYGVEGEQEVTPLLPDPAVLKIVDEYAQDFTFSDEISPQMVSAFPVFWNHRYPDLDDEKDYPQVKVMLVALPKSGMQDKPYWITRGRGMTPLERYGRCLLDEPPMSDAFNSAIRHVLERWAKYADEIRRLEEEEPADPRENMEYQRKVVEVDRVFFEFFRTRIVYGGVEGDMRLVLKALPLDPMDDYYQKGKLPEKRPPPTFRLKTPELKPLARGQKPNRAALNGNPRWLASFWAKSNIFCVSQGLTGFVDVSPIIEETVFASKVSKTRDLTKGFKGNAPPRPGRQPGEGQDRYQSRAFYLAATTNGE
jgi:hypothetical protein